MSKKPSLLLAVGLVVGCAGSPSSQTTGASSQPEATETAATPPSETNTASLAGATDSFATSMGTLHVAPIWHGTVAFAVGNTVVVVDPWSKAPEGRMPKADLILITDIHPDHLDPAAIDAVRKEGTIVVGPAAVAAQLEGVVVLANGDERTERGITIRATPMYNNTRGPEAGKLFHDKGRGNGYLLAIGDKTVYISGDTECTDEMRALRDVDVALVCMNLPYTMPPEEAAGCIKAFRPSVVIPFHYRGSDLEVLAKELAGEAGIELRVRDFYKP